MKRLLALALLAGCAQQPPASLPAERTCAILIGGDMGPGFADPQIERFWAEVNRRITQRLQARLFEQYRVEPLLIESAQRTQAQSLVGVAMAKHNCSRILQVSHDVNEDAAGRFVRYDISMLGTKPSGKTAPGGTVVTTTGLYAKSYRYARTMEFMKTFSPSEFGDQVFKDLEASGVLQGIRR